ncbi:hypothetical protein D3C85_1802890 [compost metagenome]
MDDQPRGGRVEDERGVFDLGGQCLDSGQFGSMPGPRQGIVRRLRLQAANGNPRHHQFMGGTQHRR